MDQFLRSKWNKSNESIDDTSRICLQQLQMANQQFPSREDIARNQYIYWWIAMLDVNLGYGSLNYAYEKIILRANTQPIKKY